MGDGEKEAEHGGDAGEAADKVQPQVAGAQIADTATGHQHRQQHRQADQITTEHDHFYRQSVGEMLDHRRHDRQQTFAQHQQKRAFKRLVGLHRRLPRQARRRLTLIIAMGASS